MKRCANVASRHLAVLLLVAMSASCTKSSPSDQEEESSADGMNGTGSETMADDSGATDGSDGTMIPDVTDAGGDDDSGTEPLFPLTFGRWWRYEAGPGVLYDCAGNGPIVAEVIGAMELEGVQAAVVRPGFADECGFDNNYYENRGGDDYWQFFPAEDEKWQQFMIPPEHGATWDVPGALLQMEWRYVGQYTVPAGTFNECWARETTAADMSGDYVYCRGIGLVSLKLFFEGGATLELVEYGE